MTKAARANKKKKTVTDAGVTKPKAPTKCAKKQYGKAKTETPGSIPSGSNCSGLVTAGEKTQTGPGYGLGNNCGSVTQGNPLQQRLADLREVCSFFNEVRSIFAPSPAPPAPPGFIYDTFCFTCALLKSACYRFLLIIRLYEFIYVTVCSLQCQYQLGHRLTSLRLCGPRSPLLLQLLQPHLKPCRRWPPCWPSLLNNNFQCTCI